jgi:hypothetical protein
MSVDKASGINHDLIGRIVRNQNLVTTEGTNKNLSGVSGEVRILKGRDEIDISSEARELNKTLYDLKAEIKQVPGTREEKIKIAKARIEDGVYDRDAIIKEVAGSIKDSILI